MRGRSLAGALLVAIGVALLVIDLTGVGGVAVVLLGGLAFLATHFATRSYGFLVPGGILTGFGAALVAQDLDLVADVTLIGLGGGFLLIPLVQLATRAPREGGWWWPVIPGGILVAIGAIEVLQGDAAGLILPAILIILGLSFLLSAALRRPPEGGASEAARDAPPRPTTAPTDGRGDDPVPGGQDLHEER